jgi:hypothetical protein
MAAMTSAVFRPRRVRRRGERSQLKPMAAIAVVGLALSVCGGMALAQENLTRSGTVKIQQVQLAFIGSGNLGGGTLEFRGQNYRFSVGGLGIGGFGVSEIKATGEVYNLNELRFFPGAYAQARYGMAVGDVSTGELWLENSNGVVLKLKAEREGLALSLGADAVYINFE